MKYIFLISVAILSFLKISLSHSEVHPIYSNGTLLIPRIDLQSAPGEFQNVKFVYSASGGWELSGFHEIGEGIVVAPVETVEVIKTATMPVQVFLRAKGSFGAACSDLDNPNILYSNSSFQISLHTIYYDFPQQGCIPVVVPFDKLIPLSVYGLTAGAYAYDINGVVGSFELADDNVLPEN